MNKKKIFVVARKVRAYKVKKFPNFKKTKNLREILKKNFKLLRNIGKNF